MPAEARRPTGPGVVAVVGAALSTRALAPGEGSGAARVGWTVEVDGAGAGAQAAGATTAAISAATTDARAHHAEVAIRTRYARVFVAGWRGPNECFRPNRSTLPTITCR